MTRLEKVLGAVLTVIVLAGGGAVLGRVTSPPPAATRPLPAPGRAASHPARGSRAPAAGAGSPAATMPVPAASGFANSGLATMIAKRAGAALAGASPRYVPARQVRAEAGAVPAGARMDAAAGTITFTSRAVSLTAVAVPPGGPDMSFRIGGLVNPAVIVPRGARVRVTFINADTDEAHGWEVTPAQPPFAFHAGGPAFPGSLARPLGDPVAARDGAETVTFTATRAGRYQYVCPMPGHAQMGMHGQFLVRQPHRGQAAG